MADNRYILQDDYEIYQAGFQNLSPYDLEKQKLLEKYDIYSEKSQIAAMVLCLFGLHRFYVGKIGTGLLYFLTGGGLMLWTICDFCTIAAGKFKDKSGRMLNGAKDAELNMKLIQLKQKYGR